jgi:hypothetical protein
MYHIVILFYLWQDPVYTRISLCIYAPLWRQNHFESLSLWRWLLPPIFLDLGLWSGSSLRLYYLKHVTLMWINYLETWPQLDNTPCSNTCQQPTLVLTTQPRLHCISQLFQYHKFIAQCLLFVIYGTKSTCLIIS